jgi:hypothetical protein
MCRTTILGNKIRISLGLDRRGRFVGVAADVPDALVPSLWLTIVAGGLITTRSNSVKCAYR